MDILISCEFQIDSNKCLSDIALGIISSVIGYGIGKLLRYNFSKIETRLYKKIASKFGNNKVNHLFKKMLVNNNIGAKDTLKISNALYRAEKNYIGILVESIGSTFDISLF